MNMSVGNKKEDVAKWYAVYTYPRHEKKLAKEFEANGIECFCPLNKVEKQWSDRKKVVFVPLFQSYVFVYVSESDFSKVRNTKGVLNFVYWQGKPAVIKEKEIIAIKRFLDEYENVEVKPIEVKVNEREKITTGPLMDQEGQVWEGKHKKATVAIDSLGYILVASVEKTKLAPVKIK